MACNSTGTFYWAGVTFQSATQLYTDSNLTIVAADGWYSIGGFYREMTGGILGPTQNCPTCEPAAIPCNTSLTPPSGSFGKYTAEFDAGNTTGAIIVLFNPATIPDRCTWTYDGVSASEYSSPGFGYLQGVIGSGGPVLPLAYQSLNCGNYCTIDNSLGGTSGIPPSAGTGATFCGENFTYNHITASWDVTPGGTISNLLGPYTNQANGGVSLVASPNTVGICMMVIPKPNVSPSIVKIEIEGIDTNTEWFVSVNCPIRLNEFKAGVVGGICGDETQPSLFTATPQGYTGGVSNIIQEHDWIFLDPNGENYCPAGIYPVTIPALGGSHFVTVGPNSVVTNVVPC